QTCWQRRLPRPNATDRTEASDQKIPVNLRRQKDQRVAKIDDLLQRRTKQIVLTIVAGLAQRLSSNSESRRQKNHELPKSGIPKRKKTETHPRLSCKIQYLFNSNYSDASITSEFFTDDEIRCQTKSPVF